MSFTGDRVVPEGIMGFPRGPAIDCVVMSRVSDVSPESVAMISLAGVSKHFGKGFLAIQDVDLQIDAGEFIALIGPSGCGKTTLLQLMAGILEPTHGTIRIDGGEASQAHDVACCFQDPRLLPWRNVEANVGLPLELEGVADPERRDRVAEALRKVGLSAFLENLPHTLSGGMRMRVSIARALVTRPRLLLLDEPFGALDEVTREQLEDDVIELSRRECMTTVLVTHSIRQAVYMASRIMVMDSSPGRLRAALGVDFGPRESDTRTSSAFNEQVRRIQLEIRSEGHS